MKKIYLDNAATTAVLPEVAQTMFEVLTHTYGNPSSTHSFGREAKVQVETARKAIAKHIHAQATEIIFTSCGTEGDNWVLQAAVNDLKVTRIVTTKLEHHAVLHTLAVLQLKNPELEVVYLPVNSLGEIAYSDLETVLSSSSAKTLVSLMHVNNEIGTVLDLVQVGAICKAYQAYFHSDTVQAIGKTNIDVQAANLDFLVASAHKFHGPKGVGFVYVKKNTIIQPLLHGGEQEKGFRAGTEAVHQIVGMAKALDLAYANLGAQQQAVTAVKNYAISAFKKAFPAVAFNGGENGFYNILNVRLPLSVDKTAMILFYLDMKGIAVSRGSACQSGSIKPSHVLAEILDANALQVPSLRLSFSHENTPEDIDALIEAIQSM
ncbi:cysteine desulfurase [Flavobacterium agricola]|uniref:cysteine desulfurase n=1 Tax=Flavobacterium agricola TaxID=2870839 RepID=A0ABY6M2S4_9FLAO|nr:cysteine desulfurase family protein [Flavobacterium agricola]UYW01735.1 cysteine desulfurase [Flavobacterium agricola]